MLGGSNSEPAILLAREKENENEKLDTEATSLAIPRFVQFHQNIAPYWFQGFQG